MNMELGYISLQYLTSRMHFYYLLVFQIICSRTGPHKSYEILSLHNAINVVLILLNDTVIKKKNEGIIPCYTCEYKGVLHFKQ